MDYAWPGNVRELQNVVRAYLLTPGSSALEMEMERRQRKSASSRPTGFHTIRTTWRRSLLPPSCPALTCA